MRPNYVRISAAGLALAVTLVALLAGIGVIPLHRGSSVALSRAETGLKAASTPSPHPSPRPSASPSATAPAEQPGTKKAAARSTAPRSATALPADSGTGRRIVFDIARQRVWLVDAEGRVASTYLVSGSLTDNLHPGRYAVYSKSRWAVGVDDSGVMQYFVRFAHGVDAAIGFHSIPTKDGRPLQTRSQLGTPESHGCIRQWLPDAIRLWNFAPVGTKVVVTP